MSSSAKEIFRVPEAFASIVFYDNYTYRLEFCEDTVGEDLENELKSAVLAWLVIEGSVHVGVNDTIMYEASEEVQQAYKSYVGSVVVS